MTHLLPLHFRKESLAVRRQLLQDAFSLTDEEVAAFFNQHDLGGAADLFVESSIGTFPVPLGIASGFVIDGEEFAIPMATEEPSVILGASYAATLVSRGGGFSTWSDPSITSAQVFLKNCTGNASVLIDQQAEEIGRFIDGSISAMVIRGGGFRGISSQWADDRSVLCVTVDVDVCDAMGANCVNTVAEALKPVLERITSGRALMGILTNSASKRKAGAKFTCPGRLFKAGACLNIVEANRVAHLFPERAVTHNKGIMNGISALALATGNDTRAIEAGAHFYAQSSGHYQPLTTYHYDAESDLFSGEITVPLAFGIVGGAASAWEPSATSLKILGVKSARCLAQVAASLGLAQNLAALLALVTDGIQKGHMKLHQKKMQKGGE